MLGQPNIHLENRKREQGGIKDNSKDIGLNWKGRIVIKWEGQNCGLSTMGGGVRSAVHFLDMLKLKCLLDTDMEILSRQLFTCAWSSWKKLKLER